MNDVNRIGAAWRKSSRSNGQTNCVELAQAGFVRDSKNPTEPALAVALPAFLAAVKAGTLDNTRQDGS